MARMPSGGESRLRTDSCSSADLTATFKPKETQTQRRFVVNRCIVAFNCLPSYCRLVIDPLFMLRAHTLRHAAGEYHCI